jgi:Cu(I)/Ag(I) efflux system protein CusF
MKTISILSIAAVLSLPAVAFAQSSDHKGMDMKGMDMKGMDMKGMDMKQCSEAMKGMDMKHCSEMMSGNAMRPKVEGAQDQVQAAGPHKTTAVVQAADPSKGTVTLAHQAIASLNWPAMTMSFAVKDRNLFEKLAVGKTVNVELTRQGASYVVTAVN